MTTMVAVHSVESVELTESPLGQHWRVRCHCGTDTAYWSKIDYAVDEYGRHVIVATYDRAVDITLGAHRTRNRTPDPGTSPVSLIGRFANALRH